MRAAARMCVITEASFESLAMGTPAMLDPRISWRNERVPIWGTGSSELESAHDLF
ncbi:hypothetical protein PILCRDRAFT_825447 [Piloderma croceum F 1598]|uniref:Uncharacterized protein n=1 Tax=Piloderma croceum (strain F 1598) TaxID=765440 RepID=A0A0C3FC10_PILCF|nr:hypothetical protein PILCRDRAFT_825447 [Piloderma croceum F 1598]